MICHLQQPKDSHLCGQTCVAMITGVSIEKSIEVFGTRGGTRTKQVVAALRKFGIATVTPRLVRWNGQQRPPDYAILHMIWKNVSGARLPGSIGCCVGRGFSMTPACRNRTASHSFWHRYTPNGRHHHLILGDQALSSLLYSTTQRASFGTESLCFRPELQLCPCHTADSGIICANQAKKEIPVNDVIVVCPNCHRALHQFKDPSNWKAFRRTSGLSRKTGD